jgi:hypothetical protein
MDQTKDPQPQKPPLKQPPTPPPTKLVKDDGHTIKKGLIRNGSR